MNHEEAIAILLNSGTEVPTGPGPSPADRRQAEEHVADCSDCWEVIVTLHELATGERPPEADSMRNLYGCESIRGKLYLLAELSAQQIKTQDPEAAHHLGWCHACRDRLAEVLQVEREAARGEYGEPLTSPSKARWTEVAGTLGETIRELVGNIVVRVRRGAAAFTAMPEGFVIVPVMATAPVRGGLAPAAQGAEEHLGRGVSFPLAESGLSALLTLQPYGGERVELHLQVTGEEDARFSAYLRATRDDRPELVASQTTRGETPLVFRDLPAGRYILEIQDGEKKWRFRMAFRIELGA